MSCIVVKNRHGNLAFRLFWDGIESWEGTAGLKDTSANRKLMEARAVIISNEIERGEFDYLKHFPGGNKAKQFQAEKAKAEIKTIRQYYDEWIKDKVPPIVKKSLGRKYRTHFNVHILPFHGDRPMGAYSVTEIRELRAYVAEKGLAIKTVKNVVNASLRALFRDAEAEKVIARNPFNDLPKKWWKRTTKPPPDPFTEFERDQILAYFRQKYWNKWPQGVAFLVTQFWTGTRPSESTPRRWKDYDPQTGKLSIETSRAEGEEGATKTAKSFRTIDLLEPVKDCLEQIRPLTAKPDDYIFTNRVGKPIDQKQFAEQYFWPMLSVLKIKKRDFYGDRFHGTYPPNFNEGTHLISRKGPTRFQVAPFIF